MRKSFSPSEARKHVLVFLSARRFRVFYLTRYGLLGIDKRIDNCFYGVARKVSCQ